jgi:hypothetical protein
VHLPQGWRKEARMSCWSCQDVETLFGKRMAERDLRRYRKSGPARTTRILLDALIAEGVEDATLLDIGGGVGPIPNTLLAAGARSVVAVEASTAYLRAARREAERLGHRERTTYHHGDFLDLTPKISPADVVTLDRAICCYDDMEGLVGASAERATRLYGVVYPRDVWWNRVGVSLLNLVLRLWGSSFRVFVHPSEAVERAIVAKGLEKRLHRETPVWQIVLYARTESQV